MAFTSPSVTRNVGAGLLAPGFGRIAARSRDRRHLVDAMAENAEVGALLRESAPAEQRRPGVGGGQSEYVPARETGRGFCHDDSSLMLCVLSVLHPQLGRSGFTRCTTDAMATSGVFIPSTAARSPP